MIHQSACYGTRICFVDLSRKIWIGICLKGLYSRLKMPEKQRRSVSFGGVVGSFMGMKEGLTSSTPTSLTLSTCGEVGIQSVHLVGDSTMRLRSTSEYEGVSNCVIAGMEMR